MAFFIIIMVGFGLECLGVSGLSVCARVCVRVCATLNTQQVCHQLI